ncbi:PucR family transcriptional regulator ligand-binding domain-containing protein [Kribbella sp. NPDC051770]|uniref:PucR family transcriptional regulator n=1 Tax=Kribbella sp. NPDC051770 TaxID=3155413 RepID=UPI00342DF604
MLTLAVLLQDPSLELDLLVAGADGSLEREVLWVHNTELPDPSPYLREGEIVLTNGLWLPETPPSVFVAAVQRAGAAGIVYGLRAASPQTPDELIRACEQYGVPLLQISIDVPFTAITQAASAAQADQRREALVDLVRRGDALAQAISHGAGASGVLAVLRREHDLPLAVVDRMARLLASAGIAPPAEAGSAEQRGERAEDLAREEREGGREREGQLSPEQLRVVADGLARRPPPLEVDLGGVHGSATVFLVGAVGDTDAALLALKPVTALSRAEQDALDQAARFLSLEVAKQQAVQAIELRFASELLDMILSGAQRAAEVPDRLRAFGVDPYGELLVLAAAFADSTDATLPGFAETVGTFFLDRSLAAVVTGGSHDVVAVLQRPQQEARELAAELRSAVSERFPGRRVVIGLSEPAATAHQLREPLVQARKACQVLKRRPDRSVATFDQLGTHHVLLALQDPETLRSFAAGVLQPLRAYDRGRDTGLESTLRAYLQYDGQYAATAAALYIHVNTLRNRLAKITELTGRDATRTEDRVDLYLALEADELSQG